MIHILIKEEKYGVLLLKKKFNQLNLNNFNHDKFSKSYKNVIRGIHYDSFTTKLVTAIYGSINQIVVDLRQDSPTFKNIYHLKLILIIDFLCLSPQWLEMRLWLKVNLLYIITS